MLVADATETYGQVASLYSQLTGVLAGFAFSGLVFLLTRRLEQRETRPEPAVAIPTPAPVPVLPPGWRGTLVALLTQKQPPTPTPARTPAPALTAAGPGAPRAATTGAVTEGRTRNAFVTLLASFLGLTVTSLGYAVLAGEPNDVAAATEHTVAGVGFAASALALLLAIVDLLGEVAPHVERFTQAIVSAWAPILVLVYIVTGVYQTAFELNLKSYLWLNIGTVAAVLAPAIAVGIRSRRRAAPLKPAGHTAVAGISVALALAASLGVPIINILAESGQPLSFWFAAVALGAASLWSTVFSWNSWTAPRKQHDPVAAGP